MNDELANNYAPEDFQPPASPKGEEYSIPAFAEFLDDRKPYDVAASVDAWAANFEKRFNSDTDNGAEYLANNLSSFDRLQTGIEADKAQVAELNEQLFGKSPSNSPANVLVQNLDYDTFDEALSAQNRKVEAEIAAQNASTSGAPVAEGSTVNPAERTNPGGGAGSGAAAAANNGASDPIKDAAAEAADATATKVILKPDDIHSSFAGLVERDTSSSRIVMQGDPEVQKVFLQKLEAKGKFGMMNGQRLVFASDKVIDKLWKESAADVAKARGESDPAKVVGTSELGTFKFQGETGFLRGLVQGIPLLAKTHTVMVLGAGTPEGLASQQKTVDAFVSKLTDAGFGERDVNDSKNFIATSKLHQVVAVASEAVGPYQRQEQGNRFNKGKPGDKEFTSKDSDSDSKPTGKAVESLASTLANQLNDSKLMTKRSSKDKGEPNNGEKAVASMSASLKNEAKDIPQAQRAETFANFAAFAEKVNSLKEGKVPGTSAELQERAVFINKAITAEKPKGTPSVEAVFTAQLTKEIINDPKFADAMRSKLDGLKGSPQEGTSEPQWAGARAMLVTAESEADKVRAASGTTATRGESPGAEPAPAKATTFAQAVTEGRSASGGSFGDTSSDKAQSAPAADKSASASTSTTATRGESPGTEPAPAKATTFAQAVTEGRSASGGSFGDTSSDKAQSAPAADKSASASTSTTATRGESTGTEPAPTKATTFAQAVTEGRSASGGSFGDTSNDKAQSATTPGGGGATFRDKVETLVEAGPAALSKEQATSLLADLEGRRGLPLNRVDSGSQEKTTETVTRLGMLLNEVASGKFDSATTQQAKNLQVEVSKWAAQDQAQHAGGGSGQEADAQRVRAAANWQGSDVTAQQSSTAVTQAQSSGSQLDTSKNFEPKSPTAGSSSAAAHVAHAVSEQSTTTNQTNSRNRPEAAAAGKAGKSLNTSKQVSPSAGQASTLTEPSRTTQTEKQVDKLTSVMANPAGALITRAETWNDTKIAEVANIVANLNTKEVARMSPERITEVAAISAWVAKSANNGDLPGFTSAKGEILKEKLNEKASELVSLAKENQAPISAATEKQLSKATSMTESMREQQSIMDAAGASTKRSASVVSALPRSSAQSESTDNARETPSSQRAQAEVPYGGLKANPQEVAGIAAKEALAIFKEGEIGEPGLKNLLKNAQSLTPENLRSMDKDTRAQTAVAVSAIAADIKDGSLMGPVGDMSPGMQKQVANLEKAADTLMSAYTKSPEMSDSLDKANKSLDSKLSEPLTDSSGKESTSAQGTAEVAKVRER